MSTPPTPAAQRGSVIILALMLMLMLTIMAITQMTVNTSQTRIATNMADQQIAFTTAEGALNEATNAVIAGTYTPQAFIGGTSGLYVFDPNNTAKWSTIDWSSSSSVIKSFKGSSNSQSAYIIEQLPSIIQLGQNMNSPTRVYRITARGVGASGSSVVILQTTLQIQN
jgi:type IV pilus assembly protein PilX